jgi:hypothetical protein
VWVGQLGFGGGGCEKEHAESATTKTNSATYHITFRGYIGILFMIFMVAWEPLPPTWAVDGCNQAGKEDLDISRPQYGADVGAHVQKNKNKRNANGRQEVKRSSGKRQHDVFFSQTKRREKYERR